METYEINQDFFKKCMKAVSKNEVRYHLCGVFIHDDAEGIRHYVGTNGHILVHCKEKYEGPTLKEGIIVKPTTAMGTKKCMIHVPLQVYDESTAIMHLDKRILCDIVDGQYPAYEKVIPTDVKPETKYVAMDPEYLLLMKKILGSCTIRPLSAGTNEPHIFRMGDEMEVVIMPMRI